LEHPHRKADSLPVRRIQSFSPWKILDPGELWRYRDLLRIMALRDIKLRYKQTLLGVVWVILQPLAAALIFAVIFGEFAGLPSGDVPYILLSYTGLMGWNFFSDAVTRASNSLVGQPALVTKIYFPRVIMPMSSVLGVVVDFLVGLCVAFALMIVFQYSPSWRLLMLPFFSILILLVAVGVGAWISALGVYYRDFVYVIPFLLQVWFYATPVAYIGSLVPDRWLLLYSLNPMVAGVEGIRWAMLGETSLSLNIFILSAGVGMLMLIGGLVFFHRVEHSMADRI